MIARLVLAGSVLLTLGSLWLAAEPLLGRLFGQGEVSASGLPVPAASVSAEEVDLGPVLAFAPFGVAEGAEAPMTSVDAQIGLVLLGITTAQDPKGSRAIIAGGQDGVGSYGIGGQVAGGVVLGAVLADHVVLSVGGQDQPLHFPQRAEAGMLVQPVSATDPATLAIRLGDYRADVLQDLPGLLARLGLQATDQGYRVTPAAAPEIRQAGLQPGDLISGVNGKPLGDPSRDPALFDEVAALGLATFAVIRDGESLLMPFPLK